MPATRIPLPPAVQSVVRKRWCVVFMHSRTPRDNLEVIRLLQWYAMKFKPVYVDKVVNSTLLRSELATLSGTGVLPLLMIDDQIVGGVERLRSLEEQSKLKDLLHFGFEWPDLHTATTAASPRGRVGPLASGYGDEELFRGTYRGAPKIGAVTQLPQFAR